MQALQSWFLAALPGTATASMVWKAERFPLLAWIAHAPLGLALLWCTPPQAALAGALAGGFGSAPSVLIRHFRALLPITTIPSALALCLGSALGAHAIAALGTVWLALILPGTVLTGLMPLRFLGAPRWVSNPLACTQERCLPMVHTARAFGDLGTTSLLVLFASGIALVFASRDLSVFIVALSVITLALGFLAFGLVSFRAAVRRMDASPRLRAAAVVSDRPPRDNPDGLLPIESADEDADAAVRRYHPLVTRTLRATGHGISAAYDGAGRLLGASSSESGPVILTLDVPLSPPHPQHLRGNPG